MYPRKVVALQKSKPICKPSLDVDEDSLFQKINAHVMITTKWSLFLPEIWLKRRQFGILAIPQVEKCYVKLKIALNCFQNCFSTFKYRYAHYYGQH